MTDFNRNIIEWCEYDNNIKSKMEEVKTLKSKKDELEKNIIFYINENNLQEVLINDLFVQVVSAILKCISVLMDVCIVFYLLWLDLGI